MSYEEKKLDVALELTKLALDKGGVPKVDNRSEATPYHAAVASEVSKLFAAFRQQVEKRGYFKPDFSLQASAGQRSED